MYRKSVVDLYNPKPLKSATATQGLSTAPTTARYCHVRPVACAYEARLLSALPALYMSGARYLAPSCH